MKLEDVKHDKLYTLEEVAKFMEVSLATLRRMVRAGKIEAYNMSPSTKPLYRFTAPMVQAYYDKLKETKKSP